MLTRLSKSQELPEAPALSEKLAQGWKAIPDELDQLAFQLLSVLRAMEQAPGGPITHGAIAPDCIHIDSSQQPLHACLTRFSAAEQHPEGLKAGALIPAGGILPHDEYAAPEARRGETRLSYSDAYSVGAVLAAAATGNAPQFGSDGAWMCPPELADTQVAIVIKGLVCERWESRFTASQAQDVLRGTAIMVGPFCNAQAGIMRKPFPSILPEDILADFIVVSHEFVCASSLPARMIAQLVFSANLASASLCGLQELAKDHHVNFCQ